MNSRFVLTPVTQSIDKYRQVCLSISIFYIDFPIELFLVNQLVLPLMDKEQDTVEE